MTLTNLTALAIMRYGFFIEIRLALFGLEPVMVSINLTPKLRHLIDFLLMKRGLIV